MPPLRRAASSGLGGDLTSLGLQDAAAAANGSYLVDDLFGSLPMITLLSGSGGAFYSYGTPAGIPTIPTGWTLAQLQGHPGLAAFTTNALNDVGGFNIGTTNGSVQNGGSSPNLTWSGVVSVPQVLSTSGDRYTWAVGPFLSASNGTPTNGWGIAYTDNVSGGAFVLMEYQSAVQGPTPLGVLAAGPSANGWYKATIKVAGTTVTLTMSGASFGTQTYSVSGTSAVLNSGANNGILFGFCGAAMKRTTFTSGSHFAFVDRAALSITGLGR